MERSQEYTGQVATVSKNPKHPDGDKVGLIETWLIEVNDGVTLHALWSKYLLSVASLRAIPGVPEAVKYEPDVTHEAVLFALHPSCYPSLRPVTEDTRYLFLQPYNLMTQFRASSDERALAIAATIAIYLANGTMFLEPQGIRGARDIHAHMLMRICATNDPKSDGSAIHLSQSGG